MQYSLAMRRLVESHGGTCVLGADIDSQLIGDGGEHLRLVGIMRYPSRRAYLDLAGDPEPANTIGSVPDLVPRSSHRSARISLRRSPYSTPSREPTAQRWLAEASRKRSTSAALHASVPLTLSGLATVWGQDDTGGPTPWDQSLVDGLAEATPAGRCGRSTRLAVRACRPRRGC